MDKPLFDTEAFEHRERERAEVQNALKPILDALRSSEQRIEGLGVIDDAQRFHLVAARHEILRVLRLQHTKAHTRSEMMMRVSTGFAERAG